MNNNLSTERAHLGLFSTSSYISIGDTYGKKAAGDARLLGKQFSHEAPKEGTGGKLAANCLFEREYKVLYNGEKYAPEPPQAAERFASARLPGQQRAAQAALPTAATAAALPRS